MWYSYRIFRMTDGSLSVLCIILFSPKQGNVNLKIKRLLIQRTFGYSVIKF